MGPFKLRSEFRLSGDQPEAVAQLARGVEEGQRFQALLGVTGSGKTFTAANVIALVGRPTLVIAHNKTLAAQLCQEFRTFFPQNAVEYFVSYYDYYQPEAYIPQSDTYIEKDSSINDEIDRLRHSATQALLTRRDVIVVASVSCIYNLGSPDVYKEASMPLETGLSYDRTEVMRALVDMQYERNDVQPKRGTFRVRGEVLEIAPADRHELVRCEFFGDELERLVILDPVTRCEKEQPARYEVFPATHYVTLPKTREEALGSIQKELEERLRELQEAGKLLEAQRLGQRTRFDLEMIREIGYCNGIENYSRHFDGRAPGEAPKTLLDYFPDDYLIFIDESHVTLPQLRGMYAGDISRKRTLVEHGFRLPSALDNRPLSFEEFLQRANQIVFVSATPGPYEREVSAQVVEQIVRPTGLVDPAVEVRPARTQVDDVIGEIRRTAEEGERVLVTTLTKKMAEDLSRYLAELGVQVRYLHSDIETLDRVEILRELRLGAFDVLVGINLLREGIDLPEVGLVAILDADKEGFLRSETSLIQTMGRAARNVRGRVILYADQLTGSIRRALAETDRRRRKQLAYNRQTGLTPRSIRKPVDDIVKGIRVAEERDPYGAYLDREFAMADSLENALARLEQEMMRAAEALEFEKAAALRDQIKALKKRGAEPPGGGRYRVRRKKG